MTNQVISVFELWLMPLKIQMATFELQDILQQE